MILVCDKLLVGRGYVGGLSLEDLRRNGDRAKSVPIELQQWLLKEAAVVNVVEGSDNGAPDCGNSGDSPLSVPRAQAQKALTLAQVSDKNG